jgi:DNA-binding XRE family transcriptional regulator
VLTPSLYRENRTLATKIKTIFTPLCANGIIFPVSVGKTTHVPHSRVTGEQNLSNPTQMYVVPYHFECKICHYFVIFYWKKPINMWFLEEEFILKRRRFFDDTMDLSPIKDWYFMTKRSWMAIKRNDLKLTQREIAEKIGISYQHYGFIENGTRGIHITFGVAGRIAAVLGMKLEEFYEMEEAFQRQILSTPIEVILPESQTI